MPVLKQIPNSNEELIRYCGDLISFSLKISEPLKGDAFLRTNIGNAKILRKEIIDSVEKDIPRIDADWYDIKMEKISDTYFSVVLPLIEIGVFSAKTFFKEAESDKICWPEGDNVKIKVEPADTVAFNSIYTAFVRQFTAPPLKDSDSVYVSHALRDSCGNKEECNSSGTFRNLIKELDHITGELGFKNIQLLPIHPVPTSFAKMGTYGSPFAVLDLKNINPAYAEFDTSSTPMQQFEELVDAIHLRSSKIFLDIPINHTGWASWLQIHFPEWFVKNPDGTFKSPGAWGTVWEDLSELDYKHKGLWKRMAEVFLFWCRRGVDGFRCDAGYMVPQPVWEYIAAKVREEFPNTIFMLEGLGGKISVTENLLSEADLNWAYSELFQNFDRSQIEIHLPEYISRSEKKGLQIHFAETHDNSRVAAKSKCYAKLRTAVAALFSQNGGFGITAGVEWYATEKIDVHELNELNWDSENNQVEFIKKLNEILRTEPAFFANAKLEMIQSGNHNGIVLLRKTENENDTVLIVTNLDDENNSFISWLSDDFPEGEFFDLISEKEITVEKNDGLSGIQTKPGEVFCLANVARTSPSAIYHSKAVNSNKNCGAIGGTLSSVSLKPRDVISDQKFKAKALEIIAVQSTKSVDCELPKNPPTPFKKGGFSNELRDNPAAFCAKSQKLPEPLCVTNWSYPQDLKREVIVPSSHFLHLKSELSFNVKVFDEKRVLKSENSLPGKTNFILLTPDTFPESKEYILKFTFYHQDKIEHRECRVIVISHNKKFKLNNQCSKTVALEKNAYAILTNGNGAMAQVRAEWGSLKSKYDSFLAANLHPDCPVDRHILFTRCRAWIVCSEYSCEIGINNLTLFEKLSNSSAKWSFCLPVGQGKTVNIDISLKMIEGENISIVNFCRVQSPLIKGDKGGFFPIKIIVRPDIENRNFHNITKAYTGLETDFPASIKHIEKGFLFSPPGKQEFIMNSSKGKFVSEPEWKYMIHLPEEAERGLDDHTDLFSPGYFSFGLGEGESVELLARAIETVENHHPALRAPLLEKAGNNPPFFKGGEGDFLRNSIKQFIVKRDDSLTVIAGYPWFLDWGRDTLIALRGIISAGFISESEEILKQFARFEKQGTLPNMIRGNDQSNRDTSDAPLWFFVACSDLINATGNKNFINENCGGRTISTVLKSIVDNYIIGTPNGIIMDAESGLIFSPSHFTWMDTNHPAGTPREGYPIEIQALWLSALDFYYKISSDEKYKKLSTQVSNSISNLFTKNPNGCLSDCLHAKADTPAQFAEADDAIRSNQLFAITLGAIKDKKLCEKIIVASEQLLIPGGIRSLANLPVKHPLPVYRDGKLLNDPTNPYFGNYSGDEDTRRKAAYHNGTAWTWPFPSYAEALLTTYGIEAINTARSILLSGEIIIDEGSILQIPEIIDGDFPHNPKGCGAQAWGVTELYRLLKITDLI